MTIEELLEKLENTLGEWINKNGFDFNTTLDKNRPFISLNIFKDNEDIKYKFHITGSLDNEDCLTIKVSSIKITYVEVEKIVLPILVKYGYLGESAYQEPITFIPPNQSEFKRMVLTNAVAFEGFSEKFKLYYNSQLSPIIKRYRSLNDLSELLEDVPQNELSDIVIKGVYKKITIWKLTNNPNYEKYIID